ncbi:hypothetical protein SAMN04490239_9286 [Rhodococcus koreensis]|uniref:4Fe-4S Wbl-type domain-containing protein n=1 Tax=Rhodococcus koreensis TaxID=99653 RepID=A0A1H5EMI4_9NOCA|nr:hypothetical protein SAMN04490239_9286 [Rhodococcus koreensis]
MNTLAGALMERPKKHLSATRSLATTSVADLVRITSLHSTMDGRCTRCGYEPTIIKPLCPEAAAALRELTQRDTKPGPRGAQFSHSSTSDLLAAALQHRPTSTGRCLRCGFTYAAGCEDCPALRAIRRELESRGVTPVRPEAQDAALCSGRAQAWEIEGQSAAQLRRSIDACRQCPLLTQCRTEIEQAIAQGEPPRGMVVAGDAYDLRGNRIEHRHLARYGAVASGSRSRWDTTRAGVAA